MSKTPERTVGIGRWGMTGIAILLGATVSVSAGAQQETPSTAAPRATPCVTTQSNGAIAPATTSATGTTTTAATTTTNGTPTGAGTTAGVAASPTPNNTSTNPDKRLTGLNATNGANGVGADTTTTGKRVPPVAEQIPSDSVRTGATVCAPTTGSGPGR
jgi:hypothetical protein